jgi:hypothetical protein
MYRSTFAHLHADYAQPIAAHPVATAPVRPKRRRGRGGRSRLVLALRTRKGATA